MILCVVVGPWTACGKEPSPLAAEDDASKTEQGAENAGWRYEELSAAERAVVDRSRDVTGWDRVHASFAAAVAEGSRAARKAGEQ